VLVGQPELRANLKLQQMRQVDQRVSVRCELSPLALGDVAATCGTGSTSPRWRLSAWSSRKSDRSGPSRSGGTPRLINLICDRALHRGHAARADRIEPEFVQQGIAISVSTSTKARPQ
jgi:general secretion pathway protein A